MILGVTWIVGTLAGFMAVLRWVTCATFLVMGIAILRGAGNAISRDNRLTRPGLWAGFAAELAVILGNLVPSLSIDRAKRQLTSPRALKRINIAAGVMLIAVAFVIPFS